MHLIMDMKTAVKSEYISMDLAFDVKDERKSFRCPQCKYITDRKNNLKRHIVTMHQESSKSLECCGVIFKSKALLRDHVSLFHRGGYCCQICGRNFCRKALLHRHLTVHSGQKDFSCIQCGYATSHKSNLERHQKVHIRCSKDLDVPEFLESSPEEDVRCQIGNCIPFVVPRCTRTHRQQIASHLPRCHLLLPKRLLQTYEKSCSDATAPNEDITDVVIETIHEKPILNQKGNIYIVGEAVPEVATETTDVISEATNDLMLPAKRVRHTSKRMFENPYKCSECHAHFTVQTAMFAHPCQSKNYQPPTLPLTNAFKKGQFKIANTESSGSPSPIDGNDTKCVNMSTLPITADPGPPSASSVKSSKKRKITIQGSTTRSERTKCVTNRLDVVHGKCKTGSFEVPNKHLPVLSSKSTRFPDYGDDHSAIRMNGHSAQSLQRTMDVNLLLDKTCPVYCSFRKQNRANAMPYYPVDPIRKQNEQTRHFWRVW